MPHSLTRIMVVGIIASLTLGLGGGWFVTHITRTVDHNTHQICVQANTIRLRQAEVIERQRLGYAALVALVRIHLMPSLAHYLSPADRATLMQFMVTNHKFQGEAIEPLPPLNCPT